MYLFPVCAAPDDVHSTPWLGRCVWNEVHSQRPASCPMPPTEGVRERVKEMERERENERES